MKGIVISTFAFIIIALVTIILLVTFISTPFRQGITRLYCSISLGVVNFLPISESLKSSQPNFCIEKPVFCQKSIEKSDADLISFEIAANVLACWQQNVPIGSEDSRTCCELTLKKINGVVDKEKVVANLPEKYKDIVDWRAGKIFQPKSIAIYYNADTKLIEVS